MRQLQSWLKEQLELLKPERLHQPNQRIPVRPRQLTDQDVHNWTAASRNMKPPRAYDVLSLRAYMSAKNRRRWERLQKDFRWVQRQMDRLGANPEDARWIL
jgi:hypothetical protein